MSFEDEVNEVEGYTVFRVKRPEQLLVRTDQGRTKGERKIQLFLSR